MLFKVYDIAITLECIEKITELNSQLFLGILAHAQFSSPIVSPGNEATFLEDSVVKMLKAWVPYSRQHFLMLLYILFNLCYYQLVMMVSSGSISGSISFSRLDQYPLAPSSTRLLLFMSLLSAFSGHVN